MKHYSDFYAIFIEEFTRMRRLLVYITMLLIFLVTNAFAQKFEKNHINYAYGLSNSQISTIKQDSLGFIWAGTQGGGVYRWDGKNLKPLHDSLKYEIIRDVLPTSYGTWVLSFDNIFKIDQKGKINSYSNIIESNLIRSENRQEDHFVGIFAISNHQYILQSENGLLLLISKQGQLLDKLDLSQKGLKAVSIKECLYLYKDEYMAQVSVRGEDFNVSVKDSFLQVAKSKVDDKRNKTHYNNGEWWIQRKDVILIFDDKFNKINELALPFAEHIFEITEWNDFYWLSTDDGLFRAKKSGQKLNLVATELSTKVYKLLKTDEGLWASTMNGIFHLTTPEIYLLDEKNGESFNGYFAFEIIDGKLWAGSYNNGIHIYDGQELVDKISFEMTNRNEISSILLDQDSVWIGSSAGLIKMHKRTRQFRKVDDIKSRVISIANIQEDIAIGTYAEGVWLINGSRIRQINEEVGLQNPTVWAIKSMGDKFFIGTEKGLFKYDNASVEKLNIKNSINDTPVTAIEKINDTTLAIGYAKEGVIIWNPFTNSIVHHFMDNNGLSSSYIYFLGFLNNRLWIGSSLGTDIAEVNDPYKVFQLQDVNKLGGAETFLNGIILYQDKVIASTIAGTIVVSEDFEALKSKTIDDFNPIKIERVESLSVSSIDDFRNLQNEGEPIMIPYAHGSMKIHFNVAHYGSEKLKFIYQLEGYEEEFSSPSDEKFAIYKQLPAGEYSFKVWRSFNNTKVGDPATVNFVITTPIYLKDWFQLSLVVFLLLVVFLFFVFRARVKAAKAMETMKIRQQAQDDLRKEMAIDFHDEMGNHLAKIINLSGVLKMWGLEKEQDKVVGKIEDAANALFTSTKDLIWSLRKENNNLEEVYFHAKDFGENLLDRANMNFRAYKNRNAEHIVLNSKVARDLSLIIKEAMTNAYKHSKAKNVDLLVHVKSQEEAFVTIADDGCGCIEASKSVGNGFRNMRQRAQRSNFELEINANKNAGCEIKISISLN